ncbi:Lipase 6 [Fulvia fulva]|uniref:Lipase 6 n=1 Tax=Passalora fulva TaxID=5499 RepID=A0A9Q8LEE3_PASFU|nr:Lipase 6 [Fulvia fulva]KAK4629553.1 Lipase 6 [Fulvia fulva]KAK4630692.1 Lipase 6 [Fulvia fulva]UJO15158.1 Lipase 6 [Fulvia fulva]WPV12999.1 Lipase 6 [Fulvia fulva]WPV27180.1 Lipase 6 [Fulvia fulva]
MLFHWLRSVCLLALIPFAHTAAIAQPVKRAIAPGNDPFYQPPAGFEAQAPGTILKTRTVISSFLGLVPTGVQTYQLLYRTTSINGTAYAAVTTVFKPLGAKKDRFVSFHTAYDSSATICNPSYNYQLGVAQEDLISSIELLLLEGFLLSGLIVSSPDYEGSDAAFGAGRLAGVATLDSMRAVTAFKDLGFTTTTPSIVGYGYSGGSIATGWGAQFQSSYAPELNIKGWALGGTVANLTGTALYIDNTAFSGFLPTAIDGLSKPNAYAASLQPVIDSIVTPYGQSKLDFANENCAPADLLSFPEMSVLSTDFQTLGDQLYYEPTIASILSQQTMGTAKDETPVVPLYVFHASEDEIISYANATTLVDTWCSNGAAVDFVTYANGGHLTTEILGFVGAYQFVQSAFDGKVATSGCTRSTSLDENLNPIALGVSLEPILVRLIDALAALGRGDSNLRSDIGTLKQTVPT